MQTSSPRVTGLSLTDELAEATNELLDLGGSAHRRQPFKACRSPLPTPSPLNLSSTTPTTLSSALALREHSKLILIHDDDGNVQARDTSIKGPDRADRATSSFRKDATPGDLLSQEDDRLPASRLSSMVASVSKASLSGDTGPASPNYRRVEDALQHFSQASMSIGKLAKPVQGNANPAIGREASGNASGRVDYTPDFFLESFPSAQEQASPDNSKVTEAIAHPGSSPISPRWTITEPSAAMIGGVTDSSVTVKLHGNGRAERNAQQRANDDMMEEMMPEHQQTNGQSNLSDDGDQSSLLSLPATTATSSQGSSKTRRRPLRQRSTGSCSLPADEFSTADDAPFARDVQIRGFNVVGEKARGFVCYDVRIITIRGTTIGILRRFSSFCTLRQNLTSERPQYATMLPALPPRRTGLLHKYASHHLEKRRRALQKWLAVVMLDRRWAATKSLREWVVGSSDDV